MNNYEFARKFATAFTAGFLLAMEAEKIDNAQQVRIMESATKFAIEKLSAFDLPMNPFERS